MNSKDTSSKPPIRLRRIGEIAAGLFVLGLVIGFVPRWISHHRLVASTREETVYTVDVVSPKPSAPDFGTPLPAEVQPFIEASIHARASGYLKNWYADIGEHVTNGQVLAEIDTPELDEQLAQSKAELDQANAGLALSKTTAERWTNLLQTASVSEQETAEKTADFTLKQANVEAAQANVKRLEDLKNFSHITAPFEGIVTVRNTDIGQLIAADSGPELFRISQTDPLRVYVRVPQQYVHAIQPGQKAELIFQEAQTRVYTATVTRTAGAVDPVSRTLQVELQVPNPRGEILAGSYAQVRFTESAGGNVLTISDNALVFRAQGMQVAVVGSDNKVQMHSVRLGRDFGSTVEVLSGIDTNDRVIVNPPDSVVDGMPVRISQPAQPTSLK